MRRIVSALWLALCGVTLAQAAEETWFSVHLDGRKIGHMRTARVPETGDTIRHEQELELRVERNGDALRIATAERSWETSSGEPLRFETEVRAEARAQPLEAEPLRKLVALAELRKRDDIAFVALTTLVTIGAANQ